MKTTKFLLLVVMQILFVLPSFSQELFIRDVIAKPSKMVSPNAKSGDTTNNYQQERQIIDNYLKQINPNFSAGDMRVIVGPQSFEDDTNTTKVIDPGYAYIMPSGDAKPVKVAIEGATAVKEVDNEDWSKEFRVYKKLGVATVMTSNIAVYRNTSLTKAY